MSIPVGTRVTLRYRLPPGHSHPMTDVIGELVTADETVVAVRAKTGVVQIAADRVVAMKALGPRPVRTSEIRGLELAAAKGWPGVEQEWVDGWQLRFGHGFTGRANSASPLGPGAMGTSASLSRIADRYSVRGLPPMLSLPDRLVAVPDGWRAHSETIVMAADVDNLVLLTGDLAVVVADAPTPDWLGEFRYRDAQTPAEGLEVLQSVDGIVGFGAIGSLDSAVLAVGRAAVTDAPDSRRWVGLTAVHVPEQHRRRGLGTLICGELVRWGITQGAKYAYLQVSADNSKAVALYRGLGFTEHHRYRYAVPVAVGDVL